MRRRINNGEKEWQCDKCKKWFGLDEEWDSNGAKEECKDIWGIDPDDNMPAVCDDCWEEIHPSKHIDLYNQAYNLLHKLNNWKEELQDIINREMFKEDLMIQIKSLVEQELDKAREEGRKELLTQPQTEEKECECCKWDDMGYTHEPYCPLFKEYKQDTPEQKEEWEEELGKLMSTWGKVLFVNKGRIGAGMQTAMYLKFYHFIKDLLSEREEFTKDDLFMLKLATNDIHNKGNGAYDEIGEKIERMLSKLNKKK